jgi:hypothetical protein
MEATPMTNEETVERLRGVWQADVAGPPLVSISDVHARAAEMGEAFERTAWVPWLVAAGISGFFLLMLVVRQAPVHRVGALAGTASAIYLLIQARLIHRRQPMSVGSPCVRVYRWHLVRHRDAMQASAVTIGLMALGSALVSVTLGAGAQAALLSIAAPVIGGTVTAWHVRRYVRRADQLIAGFDALL